MLKLILIAFFLSVSIYCPLYTLDFMAPSEIKTGMTGYGLSVFHGWEPERFGVEIIDVIKNASADGDIILARVSGQGLEISGVIAGMSGSPVYLTNGKSEKLIGAVSHTWSYTKEPICGIMPIGQMVSTKDLADSGYLKSMANTDNGLQKISLPFSVCGFEGESLEYVKKFLSSNQDSYQKTASGILIGVSGNASSPAPTNTLKGGDAVSVNLVDGDLKIQGIGTVTYVSNDDVYIFGHPMDLAGNSYLPISRSYIYSVIPTSFLSFKIGASSTPLGSTIFDGNSAVYCKTGISASMIPVKIAIKTPVKSKTFNIKIVDNKYYFCSLCF